MGAQLPRAEPVRLESAYFTFNQKAVPGLGISVGTSWRRMKIHYIAPDAIDELRANYADFARGLMQNGSKMMPNGFRKLSSPDSIAGAYAFPPDFTDSVEHLVRCVPSVFDFECSGTSATAEGVGFQYWFFASEIEQQQWTKLDERSARSSALLSCSRSISARSPHASSTS